jgi:TonB family protein
MNSREHFAAHFLRRLPLLGLLACVSVCVVVRNARAQDVYDFSSAASEVAGAIDKASPHSTPTSVLVTDFKETNGPDSQLGVVLAQNFSHSLRAHGGNFTVLDRIDVEDAISNHKLPIGALSSRSIIACYASEFGATLIIGGRIEYTPENLVLDLDTRSLAGHYGISAKKIITPLTAAMETLKSKPAVGTEAIFGEDKTVWVRDESSKATVTSTKSGANGYSYPACIHCPQAPYTDAAVIAKVEGTVTLSVVIGADGKAQRISVQRALPCGLDQRAIDAIKDWKFEPATGPGGKPAAVVQTVEVTFHLY